MHIPHWARRLDVVMLQGIDPVVNGVKIDRQHRADNREARRRPAFERCCFARLPELLLSLAVIPARHRCKNKSRPTSRPPRDRDP